MTTRIFISTLMAFLIVFSLSAQTKKKAPVRKKHEKWDHQLIDKSGNDSRFGKHKKRKFYKPGEAPREEK